MTMIPEFLNRTLHILHVDDDEEDHIIMRDLLAQINDFLVDIDYASTYENAIEILVRNEHDLCLMDYYLGALNGIELMQQALGEGCRMPFVILTGTGNRQLDLQAMTSGAEYYLDKNNLDPYNLERAIRYSLERAQMLRTVQDLNAHLEERVAERTKLLLEAKEQLEAEIAERTRVEEELRTLRREREFQVLHDIGRNPQTMVTAQLLGVRPLRETEVMERLARSSHLSDSVYYDCIPPS